MSSIPGSVGYISHVHRAYDYLGPFGVPWYIWLDTKIVLKIFDEVRNYSSISHVKMPESDLCTPWFNITSKPHCLFGNQNLAYFLLNHGVLAFN